MNFLLSNVLSIYSITTTGFFIHHYLIFLHKNKDIPKIAFLWALPTPGLRNKTGFFWQYSECRGNKAGAAVLSFGAALAFFSYKYWVSLSPYRTISWFST